MRNKTYNQIIEYLRLFAKSHIDVERFEEEDEDQMSAITSMDEKFPMMFVTPIGNSFGYQMNDYSLRIYCYDRLTKDRLNNTNIRSKTNQILNDLDVWLRKESTLPFEITETSNAVPFSSELMTDVSGWYIDILIESPSFGVCDIPFKSIPELPSECIKICPDGTVEITDSNNVTLGIQTVKSGGVARFEAPDATVNVTNSDNDLLGSVVVPSGGVGTFVVSELPIKTDFIVAAYNENDLFTTAFVTVTGTVNDVIIDGLTNVTMKRNGTIITSLTSVTTGDVITFEFDSAVSEGVILIEGYYA